RFRVLRYEQRGHGGTPAPPGPYRIEQLGADVIDLLDHLGEPRASVLGLSLGGMVALCVAANHPERVDRLVLTCTAAHLPPAEGWTERAAHVRADGVLSLYEATLGRWFVPGFIEERPDVADAVHAMLGAVDSEGYAGCCEAIGAMDQRPSLASVTAPTLVIAGADDPTTPPAVGLELASGIAGASFLVLAGAAHLANIASPERYTDAVVDHLTGGTVGERGDRTRRQVLGDAHVDRSATPADAFGAPFSNLITRYAWGDIWTRPGLDRPTRSAITVAMLVALGRFDELALHVRAARRNGLSAEEIREILLQTAIYCGVPAARAAFAVATDILAQIDAEAGA
ncbi:MAG: 4-carboxymuconolactone decarboxylase, partial [Actinomycetota bacterium]|nr:4-carboxymuconolactone decarboxylase [Actinomycetota bacterium]